MALVKCKECGHQVSKKAEICPNCGAKLKQSSSGCGALFLIVFVVGFIALIYGYIDDQSKSPQQREAEKAQQEQAAKQRELVRKKNFPERSDLYYDAKQRIESILKAPSTAKWPGIFDRDQFEIFLNNKKYHTVKSWVDAQNSFGAPLRNQYTIIYTANKETLSLTPVYVEFDGEVILGSVPSGYYEDQ